MERTVEHGFFELVERVRPKYSESDAAVRNLNGIERCLKDEFDMDYLAAYGSSGHGTNISGYSAVDCFAVIHKGRLREKSGESLLNIRGCLAEHFDDVTVTKGRPMVSVPFGVSRAERHLIVPAFMSGRMGRHDIYSIPGPNDRWVASCPGAHSAWINQLNDELNKSLKPFIRVVKAWNYFNTEPLWSFYAELSAVEFLQKDGAVVFSMDLKNFFHHMIDKGLEPFPGSKGCTEPVYGTTVADRNAALDKLKSAAELADQARESEVKGNIADAYYYWRKVFNFRFPSF